LINLIFASRGEASVLAHVLPHSVIGLTLPPIDATLFINMAGLTDWLEKRFCSVYINDGDRLGFKPVVQFCYVNHTHDIKTVPISVHHKL
jgi:hypothetical protein